MPESHVRRCEIFGHKEEVMINSSEGIKSYSHGGWTVYELSYRDQVAFEAMVDLLKECAKVDLTMSKWNNEFPDPDYPDIGVSKYLMRMGDNAKP